jgi:hypothetical protein
MFRTLEWGTAFLLEFDPTSQTIPERAIFIRCRRSATVSHYFTPLRNSLTCVVLTVVAVAVTVSP